MNGTREFYAPGRVNLIGEYTDFNGGMVLPCAINRGVRLVVTEHKSGVRLSSEDFDYSETLIVTADSQPIRKEWLNYPLGVMVEFAKLGVNIDALDFHYSGDLPLSAGLSSSAAISVLTAFAVNSISGAGLSRTDLALLAQRAENEFIHLQCGIMDQFAILNAQQDCAIALDCDSLDFEQVPLNLGDYKIVIANTNQPRELKGSAYNDRVMECQAALTVLGPKTGAQQLAHITPNQLKEHGHLIADSVVGKRARHVIEESDRVKKATVSLKKNDLQSFGNLMRESHQSLSTLFEVSSYALDCMVDLASLSEGVIGSRMTGAGFGGCTVSLVHNAMVDGFVKQVGNGYKKSTRLEASFYVTNATDGVREVSS